MPPRFTPTRLVNYPWVVVRIECAFCGRAGRFRLARLAGRYGPEQDLAGLLRDLAQDCPWYNERARKYEPRYGAYFVDLERNLPPADNPNEPVHRRRGPAGENLPKPKGADRFPATYYGGAPALSDWPHPEIELACAACGRCGVFQAAALRAEIPGGDMTMLYLRFYLTDRCPARKAHGTEQCQAVLRPVGDGQRPRWRP